MFDMFKISHVKNVTFSGFFFVFFLKMNEMKMKQNKNETTFLTTLGLLLSFPKNLSKIIISSGDFNFM